MSHPQKTTLKNGLTIITAPSEGTESITALVLVDVGSRFERAALNGGAHFIEHLLFKGTERRPSTRTITSTLDKFGAEYNAFTAKDVTGYHVKIVPEQLPLVMDILEDMLFHSLFKPEEIERERGVIIEEINMYEDNPVMSIGDLFEETLYGAHHPLGRDTAGKREVIQRMTRPQLLVFRNHHYIPSRAVIVVAGKCDHDAVVRLTSGNFLKHMRGKSHTFEKAPASPTEVRVALKKKQTAQAQVAMGFRGLHYTHPARYAATLLSAILGGSMSSRLFIEVRERRGLAYSIRTDVNLYRDAGSFSVFAGVDPARIDRAITVIRKELQRAAAKVVSAKELADAKTFVSGKFALQLEDSSTLAQYYGHQQLFERELTEPHERLRRIERVTRDQIHALARELFKRPPTLAIIGPFDTKAQFEKLLYV